MKHGVGMVLSVFVFVTGVVLSAPAAAQSQAGAPSQGARPATSPPPEQRLQPGATQGAPTNELQPTPKFNMDYFHGEWHFETNVPESPLGEGGPMEGTETIVDVYDGRFWLISIKGDGPEGPYTGNGVIIYNDAFFGQTFTR